MVLGKRWLSSIGNGAEFQPLEMGRKSPVYIWITGPKFSFTGPCECSCKKRISDQNLIRVIP